jgi:hypothetical protein
MRTVVSAIVAILHSAYPCNQILKARLTIDTIKVAAYKRIP